MTIVPSISLTLHWVVTFRPLALPLGAVGVGVVAVGSVLRLWDFVRILEIGRFPVFFASSILIILLKNKKNIKKGPIALGLSCGRLFCFLLFLVCFHLVHWFE